MPILSRFAPAIELFIRSMVRGKRLIPFNSYFVFMAISMLVMIGIIYDRMSRDEVLRCEFGSDQFRSVEDYISVCANRLGGNFPSSRSDVRVCISPEGVDPVSGSSIIFANTKLRRIDEYPSEGYWFLLVYDAKSYILDIFAVDQRKVSWDSDQSVPVRDVVMCPKSFGLELNSGKFRINPIK